jgi:hypothetical protein
MAAGSWWAPMLSVGAQGTVRSRWCVHPPGVVRQRVASAMPTRNPCGLPHTLTGAVWEGVRLGAGQRQR